MHKVVCVEVSQSFGATGVCFQLESQRSNFVEKFISKVRRRKFLVKKVVGTLGNLLRGYL